MNKQTTLISEEKRAPADWAKDRPQEYLKKVRYNLLEKLWAKMARKNPPLVK